MTNEHDMLLNLLASYPDKQIANMLSAICQTLSRECFAKARETQATDQAQSVELGRQCSAWSKRSAFWLLATKEKVR